MCKKLLDAYMKHVENSWDSAIDYIDNITPTNHDAKLLISMYRKAYTVDDYRETEDVDFGLCFRIRQFVIQEIYTLIAEGKIL